MLTRGELKEKLKAAAKFVGVSALESMASTSKQASKDKRLSEEVRGQYADLAESLKRRAQGLEENDD